MKTQSFQFESQINYDIQCGFKIKAILTFTKVVLNKDAYKVAFVLRLLVKI